MPRSPGDGKRYQTRRGAKQTVGEPDWNFLEGIIGRLSEDAKAEIKFVNELYAFVGPQHDPRKTPLLSEISPLLQNWMKASNNLMSAIAADDLSAGINEAETDKTISRADVVARFYGDSTVSRIGKMLPLEFLYLVVSAAVDAEAVVAEELSRSPTTIKTDLWYTWIALIADTLRTRKIKVSASLRTKNASYSSSLPQIVPDHYSPFLKVVLHLQQNLPAECRRLLSEDNICKEVQEALRNSSHLGRDDLIAVLAGYGAGLLGQSPKDLKAIEPNQVQLIQDLLRIKSEQ